VRKPSTLTCRRRHLQTPQRAVPAQVAAVAALSSGDYYNTQYRLTAELREQLAAELRDKCGIVVFPSVTNFLLCELPAQTADAADIVRRARTYEVFLRTGEEIHLSLGQRTIRIAVINKGPEMNRKIIEVLSTLVLSSLSRCDLRPGLPRTGTRHGYCGGIIDAAQRL